MSLIRLQEVAKRKLPFEAFDPQQVDEMMVLIAAGLLSGWHFYHNKSIDVRPLTLVRILAITLKGRKLLRCIEAGHDANALLYELEAQGSKTDFRLRFS